MPASLDVGAFIGGTFRSVWSLELLLHLKRHSDRDWSTAELIGAMRASEQIVVGGLASLVAAGLIVQDANGASRYAPASPDVERRADATEALYAKKPDAVRRIIIAASSGSIAAFSDAFRIRKD